MRSTIVTNSAVEQFAAPYELGWRQLRHKVRPLQNLDHLSLGTGGLRSPPDSSSQRMTIPGHDNSLSAALTKTLVSTATFIEGRVRLPSGPV